MSDNRPAKSSDSASYSTRGHRLPKLSLNGGDGPGKKPRGALRVGRWVIFVVGLAILAGFGGGWLGATLQSERQPDTLSQEAKQQFIDNESELISDIAKTTGQSVVSIDVASEVPFQNFFGDSGTQTQESSGTGFIISSDGVIITNRHVVPDGNPKVSVTMADGTSYENVQVLGRSAATSSLDVAFLKINDLKGKKLTKATLGDSSKVEVGDKVVAIGNALGQFANTVTSGIISGYGRDVVAGDSSGNGGEALSDLFQTDAAINQGNSGGPLVNTNGQVIGINTAVAGEGQSIGFAIPINDVKGLISSVLQKGELSQPYLGVRYVSLTADTAADLQLDIKHGAYLAPGEENPVLAGSPASRAGLQEKDIIIKVNGIELDDKTNLASALSRFQVADKITLTIIRNGDERKIQVTLEPAPSS